MALIYGEGRRSFIRLQEEIIRNQEDHTLFVWNLASGTSRLPMSRISSDLWRSLRIVLPRAQTWYPATSAIPGIRRPLPAVVCRSSFLVVGQAHTRPYIVLKCRRQNDLLRILALPIVPLAAMRGVFCRDASRGILPVPEKEWNVMIHGRTPRKVFITDPTMIVRGHQPVMPSRVGGFVIRSLPGGFHIRDALPRDAWCQEEGVFNVKAQLDKTKSAARVVVEIKSGPQRIALQLGLAVINSETGFIRENGASTQVGLFHLGNRETLKQQQAPSWATTLMLDDMELMISLEDKMVFNCNMYVVDVEAVRHPISPVCTANVGGIE